MAGQMPSEQEKGLNSSLADVRQWVDTVFANCDDFHLNEWAFGQNLEYKAITMHLDTMAKAYQASLMKSLADDLLEIIERSELTPQYVADYVGRNGLTTHAPVKLQSYTEVEQSVMDGFLVIIMEGWHQALGYQMTSVERRSVTEPTMEPVVFGPHDSTIEDLKTNIGLLRDLLRTPKLKFETVYAGATGRKQIMFGYVEGIVKEDNLAMFRQRLGEAIKVEILETTYLEDWLEDEGYSPFPQVRITERPDVAVAALLDGKIIALAESSPTILIAPALFVEYFTASEDYYQRTVFTSLIRLLRMAAFVMALTLPSMYIALTTFHPELIPTVLLLAIMDTREKIPFPAVFEALLMEFFFELLREAGIRLPRPIGSAVSIVGALVIGQAAIQAKISSPIMVIVVALTGIASFAIPQYNFGIALRVLRFPLMILAATLGGFGLMIGYFCILLHLIKLKSLNEPYLADIMPFHFRRVIRDVLFRLPLKKLMKRNARRPLG